MMQKIAKIWACNSANKPSFQNPTKKNKTKKNCIRVKLAELQARMSRGCRFWLFLHHNYQVSLTKNPSKLTYIVGPKSIYMYHLYIFLH